jgi:hypothetical protein
MLRQALAPLGDRMDPERRELLIHALAVIIGTESMIALKDVVGLDAHQSHEVRRWAIDALLKSALSE